MNITNLTNYPEVKTMEEGNNLINSSVYFAKKSILVIGWALTQIRDKLLFKEWGFDIFTDYLKSNKFEYSESQAFNWIKVYNEFKSISLQLLESVGITKLIQIAYVSNKEEREELTEKAPRLTLKELEEKVKESKRFVKNIDNKITEDDSQLIKNKRTGQKLLEEVMGLNKYLSTFRTQFKEDLKNIQESFTKWNKFTESYDDIDLEHLKERLIAQINELKQM